MDVPYRYVAYYLTEKQILGGILKLIQTGRLRSCLTSYKIFFSLNTRFNIVATLLRIVTTLFLSHFNAVLH